MRIGRLGKGFVCVLAIAVSAVAVQAQSQGKMQPGAAAKVQTAAEFYQRYLTAFEKAKTVDDILPYMAAENRKQVEATPKADREKMFGLLKIMGHSNVKVLKEEHATDGKTILTVEGIDSDKAKSSGKVTLVKEGGAWKIGEESWTSKSKG
jgi:hypothetical protein